MSHLTLTEFARRLQAAGTPPEAIPPAARRAAPLVAVAAVRAGFNDQRAPDGTRWAPLRFQRPRGGNLALLDTGRLRASVVGRAEPDAIVLGTTAPGAAVHQFGATIRPKSAKALAIPLTVKAQRFAPRQFPGRLVWLPTRKANPAARGVLAELTWKGRGKKAKPVLTAHYVLRASVTVPARPFLGFSAQTVADIAALVATEHAKLIAKRLAGG